MSTAHGALPFAVRVSVTVLPASAATELYLGVSVPPKEIEPLPDLESR